MEERKKILHLQFIKRLKKKTKENKKLQPRIIRILTH